MCSVSTFQTLKYDDTIGAKYPLRMVEVRMPAAPAEERLDYCFPEFGIWSGS